MKSSTQASRRAPGYDEPDNRSRWLRYIEEALDRDKPITIGTVDLAQHGSGPAGLECVRS